MIKEYDVVVIGGGPAGCSAALGLASSGLKTAIIEKHRFPRIKACGGLVTSKSLSFLSTMGVSLPREITKDIICSISIDSGEKTYQYQSIKPLGATVKRQDFDHYLLSLCREKGVDVYEGLSPIEIRQQARVLEVVCKDAAFRCKRLIGADGVYGNTSRLLGIGDGPSKSLCGITMAGIGKGDNTQGQVSFYNTPYPWGWGWRFSLGEEVNMGIGLPITARKKIKSFYLELKDKVGAGELVTRGSLIPAGGISTRFSTARALLAGDAGGFVDSFSGEGIYYALRTGMIGAHHVAKSLKDDNYSLDSQYRKECTDAFLKSFRQSLLFMFLSGYKSHPCIIRGSSNMFPGYMAGLMTGDINYGDILRGLSKSSLKYTFHNWIK